MVQIRVNPDLTEGDVPALVAELEKLSSLNPVKDKLVAAGKSLEPLPSEKMVGSRPRENDVFLKDYVDGALELAQMLGIEDQGTISPSKGLSFRASNYKFYDFMGYWSALIKRFSRNEDRLGVFEQNTIANETRLNEIQKEGKSLALTQRCLYDYVEAERYLTNKKLESFEAAASIITEHVGDFATKAHQLDETNVALAERILLVDAQNKKLKKQLFWFAVFSAIPTFYLYYTILTKLF